MRVFVTGATGFIGSALVPELLGEGHEVLGLARSDRSAAELSAAGADVHRGDLEDLESLRRGAEGADGVIHVAFDHDFSSFDAFVASSGKDRRAIEAIGDVLAGSGRPFVVTAGPPPIPGRATTEDDATPIEGVTPRLSESATAAVAARGVRASIVRLPQVHDREKHGLVTYLIAIARERGVSAYVGDGLNRWPAVHRLDVASLYRLALERGEAGARYHAIAEEGVPLREIAAAIGAGLNVPVVSLSPEAAQAHFGWLAGLAAMDAPASSALTQARLGWRPGDRPGMIADLERATAFEV